jgi:hypothetical protein
MLVAGAILLPVVMGHVGDEFGLVISTKILLIVVL